MMRIFFILICFFLTSALFSEELKNDTTYYRSGEIKRIKRYNKMGEEHGIREGFSKSGEKVLHAPYKNGVLHGKATTYHKNGKKKYVSISQNGLSVGWSTKWDSLGNPTDSTFYENDKMRERYLYYKGTNQVRKHEFFQYSDADRLLAMQDTYSLDGHLISQVRSGEGISHDISSINKYSGIDVYKNGKTDYRDYILAEKEDPRHARKPLPEDKVIPWDVEKYGTIRSE